MAEGILGGILGVDEEKPEVESPEALASAEAFAAAVAAIASRQDPQVARDTSAFLKEQTELIRVQKEHLKDEHQARLHFLRDQAREVDIRRFGLRLRVGFQLFLVLVATVIGIGGIVLIHDAVTSRSVIIEPFEIPHALADRGLTGIVVASGVLDQLTRLQAATLLGLGDEEGVWRLGAQVRKMAGGRPGRAPEVTYVDSDGVVRDLQAALSSLLTDADSTSGGTFTLLQCLKSLNFKPCYMTRGRRNQSADDEAGPQRPDNRCWYPLGPGSSCLRLARPCARGQRNGGILSRLLESSGGVGLARISLLGCTG
jgi:hypothetical protein